MSVNGINPEYLREQAAKARKEEQAAKAPQTEQTDQAGDARTPKANCEVPKKDCAPSIFTRSDAHQQQALTTGIRIVDSSDTFERTTQQPQDENNVLPPLSDEAQNIVAHCKEQNKDNKSVTDSLEFCKKGIEFNEAAKKAHELDMEQVSKTTDVLQEQFTKNPELRRELQEHFSELDADIQKALILDFERRAKNGEDVSPEVKQFITGLKDSDLLVKSFAHVRLRGHCSDAQLKKFDDTIGYDITYQQAKNKYESAMSLYDLTNSDNPQDGAAALKRNVNEQSEYQGTNAQILANSSLAQENPDFRNKYNEHMRQLSSEAQPEAVNAALNSKYFTENDRNNTISQIKNFESPDAQKKSAEYADKCERLTSKNRQFLATQIKFLHTSIQASVMRSMMQNQLNTQNKDVMNTIAKEVVNLKIDENAKNEILTAVKESGKVSEATIKQIEKVLSEQSAAQNSETQVSLLNVGARAELAEKLYNATGNIELLHLIASNTLGVMPSSVVQFVDLLAKGTITPELVEAAGYKNSLKTNFGALTRDSQEHVFNMLSADEISEMWEKGKIPKRFEDRVMAKLSENMTTKVAFQLGQTSSFSELVNFSRTVESSKHQNIFHNALKERFADRLEDIDGGLIA